MIFFITSKGNCKRMKAANVTNMNQCKNKTITLELVINWQQQNELVDTILDPDLR